MGKDEVFVDSHVGCWRVEVRERYYIAARIMHALLRQAPSHGRSLHLLNVTRDA